MDHMRFPSVVLRSADEFRRFREENRDLLDERYRREQALASKDPLFRLRGICGPCLRPTVFSSATERGEARPDGRIVPRWREQQLCGCELGLNSRQRALLQLILPRLGERGWFRAAALGGRDALVDALKPWVEPVALWPRVVPADASGIHLVICSDQLHRFAALDKTLQQVAHALCPGGVFAFSAALDIERETTRATGAGYDIGWDITDRARSAGFDDCVIHCYWSEELGYLGTFNFVFEAFR
jgi:SAM-dependent methyltransferase